EASACVSKAAIVFILPTCEDLERCDAGLQHNRCSRQDQESRGDPLCTSALPYSLPTMRSLLMNWPGKRKPAASNRCGFPSIPISLRAGAPHGRVAVIFPWNTAILMIHSFP